LKDDVTKKGRLMGTDIESFSKDISSENDVEGLAGKDKFDSPPKNDSSSRKSPQINVNDPIRSSGESTF
jgi:hypothetical protein